jgi:hypothetical protein
MPSKSVEIEIRDSMLQEEKFEDFAYMVDFQVRLRTPYHPDFKLSEDVGKILLCVAFPAKDDKYKQAMQSFRLDFTGVAINLEYQAEFSNSIMPASIMVDRQQAIIWKPSLYFQLPPRLRESGQSRFDWF